MLCREGRVGDNAGGDWDRASLRIVPDPGIGFVAGFELNPPERICPILDKGATFNQSYACRSVVYLRADVSTACFCTYGTSPILCVTR
jgi:hypothetical protein